MSFLKNYSIYSGKDLQRLIGILFVVAIAYVTSWILLNSTFIFLIIIFSTLLLCLYLKDNLSYFYLVLYGLLICIPWAKSSQMPGQLGWGAPSGAIFGIRIGYTYVMILLFLFFIAVKKMVKERNRLISIPNFHYFIIFITTGIISAALGLNPEEGLLYILTIVTIPMIGGFLISFYVTKSEKSFKSLTWGIMLLTSIISLYALYEFVVNKNPIEMFVVEHLPVDPMETVEAYHKIKTYTYRSSATLGNPIPAAFVLMAGFLLSTGYYIYYSKIERSKKSIIVLFLLIINFSGVIVTFSRWTILSAIISIFIFMLPYIKNIRRTIIIVSFIILVFICIIQLGLSRYPQYNIIETFSHEYILSSRSFEHRFNSYFATIYILKAYPLLGIGFVDLNYVYNNIFMPVVLYATTLDNTYLEILSYSGILGFIAFMLLILKYMKSIRNNLKNLKKLKIYPVLYAMYCATLGMLISFMEFWSFGQLTSSLTFWTFMGILASVTLTDIKFMLKKYE